ncbi:MAG: hypothetical protein ACHQF2_08140 [Flavobacteriales bacterium]
MKTNLSTKQKAVHVSLLLIILLITSIFYARSESADHVPELNAYDSILKTPDFHSLPLFKETILNNPIINPAPHYPFTLLPKKI